MQPRAGHLSCSAPSHLRLLSQQLQHLLHCLPAAKCACQPARVAETVSTALAGGSAAVSDADLPVTTSLSRHGRHLGRKRLGGSNHAPSAHNCGSPRRKTVHGRLSRVSSVKQICFVCGRHRSEHLRQGGVILARWPDKPPTVISEAARARQKSRTCTCKPTKGLRSSCRPLGQYFGAKMGFELTRRRPGSCKTQVQSTLVVQWVRVLRAPSI